MKITKALIPLVLIGSVAFAGQSGQTAPKPPQHKAPLAPGGSTTVPSATMNQATDTKAPADKAAETTAMATKITKEQAGTIAAGTMKGSEVASSELKTVGGKQVWAVTLKSGDKKHEVMVDASDGAVVKQQPKHMKHHKEGASADKH